jgi:hypothetical protein
MKVFDRVKPPVGLLFGVVTMDDSITDFLSRLVRLNGLKTSFN